MLQQFAEGVAMKMQAVVKDLEKKREKKKEPGTDRSVFFLTTIFTYSQHAHICSDSDDVSSEVSN